MGKAFTVKVSQHGLLRPFSIFITTYSKGTIFLVRERYFSHRYCTIIAIILNNNGLQRIKLHFLLVQILSWTSERFKNSKSFQAGSLLLSQLSAQARARGHPFTWLGYLFPLYHMQGLQRRRIFKMTHKFPSSMACKRFQSKLLQQC